MPLTQLEPEVIAVIRGTMVMKMSVDRKLRSTKHKGQLVVRQKEKRVWESMCRQ
jgi:hypothetical protein